QVATCEQCYGNICCMAEREGYRDATARLKNLHPHACHSQFAVPSRALFKTGGRGSAPFIARMPASRECSLVD
ncbi:hypothetical protein, partial [Agrobacterium cavarae]|uniref:hypothetical protein n=1 Tax=Agrobacterium cavarae TaxID=2528239 RepID=UPI0028A96900